LIKKKKLKNKFEARIDRQLRRAKIPYKYETERIAYVLARHYIPDFIITTPLGKIYLECKGYFRPEHKAKMKAVKRQHPELDLRILFYTYSKQNERWCIKNGFRYAFDKIPKDWLKGL
jgi:predicted nuclease of restriction endonuclease-like RecB superfamily